MATRYDLVKDQRVDRGILSMCGGEEAFEMLLVSHIAIIYSIELESQEWGIRKGLRSQGFQL